MYKAILSVTTGLVVFISGCAAPVQNISTMDVATLAQKTTVKRDDFKKSTSVETMAIVYEDNRATLDRSMYSVEARMRDGDAEPSFYVVIDTMRSQKRDWAIWREAFDQDGNKFPLESGEKKAIPVPQIRDMALKEIYSARVSRDYLEQLKTKKISWKIYAESTSETFTLDSKLIEAFLIKCDQVFPVKPKS